MAYKLKDEYEVIADLGGGSFGFVRKMRHKKDGYIRAIKTLPATNDDEKDLFNRENIILKRLGSNVHPNIVHIYESFVAESENIAVIDMEYIEGKTLDVYLKTKEYFVEINDIIRLLLEISSALNYCHYDIYNYCMNRDDDGLGDGVEPNIDDAKREKLVEKYRVIHNDISRVNIMRRNNGSYVLIDFGLAVDRAHEPGNGSLRKKNGAPEFKAPEKWLEKNVTPAVDIYSFGIVLYEFLSGRVPFVYDTTKNITNAENEIMELHQKGTPQSIFSFRKTAFEKKYPGKEYVKDYPDWLEELIMKCLEKKPEDRFADGKKLYEFVQEHVAVVYNVDKKENDNLKNISKEYAKLEEKYKDLEDNNRSLKDGYETLEKKYEKAYQDINKANIEKAELTSQNAEYKQELESKIQDIIVLKREIAELQESSPTNELEKKLRTFKRLSVVFGILIGLLAFCFGFGKAEQELVVLRNEVKELKMDVFAKNGELMDTHQELTTSLEKLHSKEQEILKLEDQIKKYKIEKDESNAKVKKLESDVAKLNEEINVLRFYIN